MIGGQAIPDAAKKRVSDQPQKSRSGGSGYLSLKWPMPANCPEINPAATAKIFLILSNSGSRHFRRSGRFRHRSSVLIDRLDFTASKAVDIEPLLRENEQVRAVEGTGAAATRDAGAARKQISSPCL
jgi:hypothetical protein